VNVGRGNRLAMADLKAVVESLGHRRPVTLRASGNVVFETAEGDTDRIGRDLAAALQSRHGLTTPVFIRTAAQVAAILAALPFPEGEIDPSRVLILLLGSETAHARCAALADRDWGPERLVVTPAAAYLWCPDGLSGGHLAEAAMAAAGSDGTGRNLATLRKLSVLLAAD
jgi:uncharacterized protein (DUF1697 family)